MEKISVNLLPQEFTAKEEKTGKFYKVQAIGIFITLFIVFLSILSLSLRILQSAGIKRVQDQVIEEEQKVTSYAPKQAQLVLLKNRLTTINQQFGISSKQTEMYALVNGILPPVLSVRSFSVGREGKVLVSGLAQDSITLDNIFTDLLDKNKNGDKVKSISIETLNRGRDGNYRVSFLVDVK